VALPPSAGVAGITAIRGAHAPTPVPCLRFNGRVNAGVLFGAQRELGRRWDPLALLFVLVAVGGGVTIAAVAGVHRTETAFRRMLGETNEPNVTVPGIGDDGPLDLDPPLVDEAMQIEGVTGGAELPWMAVAPAGFPNFFSLAIVERRGSPLGTVAVCLTASVIAGVCALRQRPGLELRTE